MMPLAASNLDVIRNGTPVLKRCSFEVGAGCWFGILGMNGSGKTTVLDTLCGRLPAANGRIDLLGADVTYDRQTRALMIGAAPAQGGLPSYLTAEELIRFVADLRKADPVSPRPIWEALGVDQLVHSYIGNMSSGMRQRIALCLAFLGSPAVILLDEPFNWLDPVIAYDFKQALAEYLLPHRVVVTALHDVGTFATCCHAGILLHEGTVIRRFVANDMQLGRTDIVRFEKEIYTAFPRPAQKQQERSPQ